MGTSFKDIAPYIAGALAGLAGPSVGPSLSRGVATWHRAKNQKTYDADRSEARRRAAKREKRGDIAFEEGKVDREYNLGERERKTARRGVTEKRGDLQWADWEADQVYEGEQRVITARRRGEADAASERAEARSIASAGRSRSNQAYTEGQRARLQESEDSAALAFAELGNTKEGQKWLTIPGVEAWVAATPSNLQIMKGYADYQQDKAAGGNSWENFSRARSVGRTADSIRKELAEIEEERAVIESQVKSADGLSDKDFALSDDSDYFLDEPSQTKVTELNRREGRLLQDLQFTELYGAVSGYTMGQGRKKPMNPDQLIPTPQAGQTQGRFGSDSAVRDIARNAASGRVKKGGGKSFYFGEPQEGIERTDPDELADRY